jgi:CRP-like cAMP-binding protein
MLAPKMKLRTYKADEIVLAPGSVATTLSIVGSGVLITLQDGGPDKGEVEVVRLNPGDCFGQAGVLTGAPAAFKIKTLTRASVYEITKDDLAPVLMERPAIAAELGHILSRRAAMGEKVLEHQGEQASHEEDLANWLTTRIRALFGLK